MNEMFRKRDIQKTYWAIMPPQKPEKKAGRLTNWLIKDTDKNFVDGV